MKAALHPGCFISMEGTLVSQNRRLNQPYSQLQHIGEKNNLLRLLGIKPQIIQLVA
jgi:hypothetical protein